MDNFLKRIKNFDSINEVYSYNHFTIKSVLEYLDIWESFSEYEKNHYENLTPLDSYVNGHKEEFLNQIKKVKNNALSYGEITRSGVEKLYSYIKSINGIKEEVFYDIGSGNGKIVLHFSLISDFKKVKGIEIDKFRHLYALNIKEKVSNFENVEFINDDVMNIDISDATVLFMNDTLFPMDLIEGIFSKLKPGTHVISLEEIDRTPIGFIELDVSWMEIPVEYKHYII